MPPFRAEHVGSLLRPPALREAYRRHGAGEIDDAEFHAAQDAAIREAVEMQESVGLKVVTDGEFRRGSYWGHLIGPVAGLSIGEAVYKFHDDDGHEQTFLAPHVHGKVSRTESFSGAEFDFLKSATRVTPKTTMPSLPTFHFWRGNQGIDAAAYPDAAAFFEDFAEVFRQEIADLAARGATYIQMDEVPLAMLCDPEIRARVSAQGADPEALIDLYIKAINDAVGDRPAGMACGLHLCRGNHKGQHLSKGGYEPVAEKLFNEIKVDAFFLEYDTARAGDFSPLRLVPHDKHVVLGLVSTKAPELESPDELASRIDEAAKYLPLDNLALSPQCGFASSVAGNPVTIDIEKQKLGIIAETATKVWGET
jgi:5-methyltetrahydropteroyltriglutamate--homocysteine methyltransferase